MQEKLIAEHRRRFAGFEAIDVVDPTEIERLRQHTAVAAPLTLRWDWAYDVGVGSLRVLYEKGKVNQWNAQRDIDWSIPLRAEDEVWERGFSMLATFARVAGRSEAEQKQAAFDELAYHLSQLLHGEQAGLLMCGQLVNACRDMDEKWFAASQVADEARHVEALGELLARKLGTIYPIAPAIKGILDRLLAARTATQKILGIQCLFEGIALGFMSGVRLGSRNALLDDVLRRIEQDESRHAAFGVLSLRRALREASSEEKRGLEDFAFSVLEALNAGQQLDMLRTLGPRYGVSAERATHVILKNERYRHFNARRFMHTAIPNLRKLGLVSESSEARYRELGIVTDGGR